MMSLDRRTGTLHTLKNEYYLEVEGLKYRIFDSFTFTVIRLRLVLLSGQKL